MYDDSQSPQVETLRRHCEESISDSSVSVATAETNCKNIENYISNLAGGVNQMDARYFKSDNFPNDSYKDMNKHSKKVSEIKSALHINKPNSFSSSNSTVSLRIEDRLEDTAYVFSDLLAQGIKVLINIG